MVLNGQAVSILFIVAMQLLYVVHSKDISVAPECPVNQTADCVFLKWLENHALKSKLIYPVKDSCGSRGIAAAEDLSKNSLVVEFKVEDVISPSLALKDSLIQKIVASEYSQRVSGFKNNGFLAVSVFLATEITKNASSRFYPFLSVLPESSDGPKDWTTNDVAEVQEIGLRIVDLLVLMIALNREMFTEMKKKFGEELPFEQTAFERACDIIQTRSVGLPSLGGNALVPLFDMADHRQNRTKLEIIADNLSVKVMLAKGSVKKGEVVYSNYGDRNNTVLFLQYGFALFDNIFDTYSLKSPLLTKYNVKWESLELKRKQRLTLPNFVEDKPSGYRACAAAISLELAEYPTTEIQDYQILFSAEISKPRLKTAAKYRLGRKRVLRMNLRYCDEMEIRSKELSSSFQDTARIGAALEREIYLLPDDSIDCV